MDPALRDHLLNALWIADERGGANVEGLGFFCRKSFSSEDLAALEAENLVSRQGDALELTPAGQSMARELVRRYRLAESLMHIVFGMDAERASALGCELEHDLRPEMTDALCTFLGHPKLCPHGHPIPSGPDCESHLDTVERQVHPLTSLQVGERGRVVYIHPRSHQRLHRLTSLGLGPDVVLEVHQRYPAFCVRFEGTELAFDQDVAGDIHVARVVG